MIIKKFKILFVSKFWIIFYKYYLKKIDYLNSIWIATTKINIDQIISQKLRLMNF